VSLQKRGSQRSVLQQPACPKAGKYLDRASFGITLADEGLAAVFLCGSDRQWSRLAQSDSGLRRCPEAQNVRSHAPTSPRIPRRASPASAAAHPCCDPLRGCTGRDFYRRFRLELATSLHGALRLGEDAPPF
jgi:hypothetical protein